VLPPGFSPLARDRRTRWRLLGAAAVILPILVFVIWPRLESMTSGVIGERFGDTQLTGRDLLIKGDLESWSENIVLGIGPGMGGPSGFLTPRRRSVPFHRFHNPLRGRAVAKPRPMGDRI